jgi:hypothetical protein
MLCFLGSQQVAHGGVDRSKRAGVGLIEMRGGWKQKQGWRFGSLYRRLARPPTGVRRDAFVPVPDSVEKQMKLISHGNDFAARSSAAEPLLSNKDSMVLVLKLWQNSSLFTFHPSPNYNAQNPMTNLTENRST